VIAALAGLIVGIPTLRLSGPYFSIATLGFGLLVAQMLTSADWAGGRSGITLDPPHLGGYTFSEAQFFWVVFAVLCGSTYVVRNLRRGMTGLALVALRESEPAAQACGVRLARYKVFAFAISAMFAGIAGALYAHWSGFVIGSSFGLPVSILFVAIIVIGGLDSAAGSVLGAIFLTGIQEKLQDNPQLAETLYGAIIVIVLLFVPGGLVRLPARIAQVGAALNRRRSSVHA
jgi:branched-chain amino acid transport system permease protein